MSSPPPPLPPSPPPQQEEEEERTDDDDEMEEDDDPNPWVEESESEDDDDGEEECRDRDKGHGGGAAAVVEEQGAEATTPAGPICCVCLEPWTCADAHRVCCIVPCGHVYGRSCLERWLRRCGDFAKCPQCGQPYELDQITDLYPSGNGWDGCCRLQIQELKARLGMTNKNVERLMADVPKLWSDVAEAQAKLRAVESQIESVEQLSWEKSALDAAAVVEAEFLSMKEQLRKMTDQQNATPLDLLGFMEQNGANLWKAIRHSKPIAPPAS